jgi:hypothetical protein
LPLFSFILPPSPFSFFFHYLFISLSLHPLYFLSAEDYTSVVQRVQSHSVRSETVL